MGIFYLIVLLILIIAIITFSAVLKIAFTLDTEREYTKLTVLWLYPFLKVEADSSALGPLLTVTLFNRKIYRGRTGKKKKAAKSTDLLKSVSTSDIQLSIRYGFRDPFVTGITCGAINMVTEYADFISVSQEPDFVSGSDYISVNATAKVNVGNTIINFIKSKRRNKTEEE